MFNLSEALAIKEDQGLPSEYKMVLSKVDQSIGVFSRRSAGAEDTTDNNYSKEINETLVLGIGGFLSFQYVSQGSFNKQSGSLVCCCF